VLGRLRSVFVQCMTAPTKCSRRWYNSLMHARRARGLLAAFGVFGAFWGGWAAVLPDIKSSVGGSDAAFRLALLGVGTGALPAMLAMGVVYDRYGERTVAPLLVLFALSTLLPGSTSSVVMLFAALLVIGALSGMLDVAINAATTAWEASTGGERGHDRQADEYGHVSGARASGKSHGDARDQEEAREASVREVEESSPLDVSSEAASLCGTDEFSLTAPSDPSTAQRNPRERGRHVKVIAIESWTRSGNGVANIP
jgi:hypothetical protein